MKQETANRIKAVLKRKGLTRKEFADIMDVQQPMVTRWLSGNHNFTIRTICKIEERLGEDIIIIGEKPLKPVQYKYAGTFTNFAC